MCVVERFQRGDMLGEIAVLDDQPRTATGRAASPSTLLVIQRDDFHAFLERFPHYRQRLISILAQRLRRTSDLVSEMLAVESGVVLPPDQHVAARFQTTIVGYGRYGNNYIGPKYAKPGYPWQAVAIVDPHLTRGRFAVSMLGRRCPDCLLFRSFQEWYDGYFAQLTPDRRARQVVEIPLKPEAALRGGTAVYRRRGQAADPAQAGGDESDPAARPDRSGRSRADQGRGGVPMVLLGSPADHSARDPTNISRPARRPGAARRYRILEGAWSGVCDTASAVGVAACAAALKLDWPDRRGSRHPRSCGNGNAGGPHVSPATRSSMECMCGPAPITIRRRFRNAARRIGIIKSER